MRYNYKGFWCDSVCDIEVNRRNDGKYVFVVTEPPNNPGTSMTNYGEHLATAVRRQHGLKPGDLIWIEHHLESKDQLFFKLAIPKLLAQTLMSQDWYIDADRGITIYEFER
jgi:hypothetical protein